MASSAKKRTRGNKASSGKKKRRHSGSDDDEPAFLSSKYAEPPTSKIYNSRFHRKDPAELFRKDLISAMKLPDSEPLTPDDYWLIEDSWKPEWERGVQVPIYPDALPEPSVRILRKKSKESTFRLPKKFIRFTRNDFFNPEVHVMSYTNTLAERTCRYDMDDVDLQWLTLVNEDREDFGLQPLEENVVEQIIEEFEAQSYANFQEAIKSEEGLGVEYDEDAICDVCRSPDSQEGNEMVFCDSCNICVHQICYGITKIPEGSWVCRTCALGIRPACVLCPNRGGAMKTTRCGQSWAHVGCAVWIPEVSFFNFVKMEPITKISHIPPSRWSLLCSICKEKVGACIQCSEKNCKVAFHVTCAFQEGLQMKASVKLTNADDDKLQAFCPKHSKKLRGCFSDSEEEHVFNNNKKETLTSEERANIRQQKIQAKEAEFYNYVSIDDVAEMFEYDRTDIEIIYNYWKLKRRANWNRALLPPRIDNDNNCMEENSPFVFLKKLVHRRQDLERARNLCYMSIKREKLAKKWIQCKEHIFNKQCEILSNKSSELTEEETAAVMKANLGDMSFDKKHTGLNGPSPNVISVLSTLAGEEYVKTHLNGAMKSARKNDRNKSERTPNPYAKHYLNGLVKRSQRWLCDKQRKVSSLQSSLDVRVHTNHSFQSSDHLVSDDGCESSKDLHDLNLDKKITSLEDSKFECFNTSDNAFVNLETYQGSDTPIKEEKISEEKFSKEVEVCLHNVPSFSQSSNDSTFASPPKVLYESLDECVSDNERKIIEKSSDGASCNHESKSCSGLETEKQNSNLTKKEQIPLKQKSKVLAHRSSKSKKNIEVNLSDSIVVPSEDISNSSNSKPVVECPADDFESIKLSLESCIDVISTDKVANVEIPTNTKTELVFDVKPKLEKCLDLYNDDKLKSPAHCVIVKSEIPLPTTKGESVSVKVKSAKLTETCDKTIKNEISELTQNGESNKIKEKSTSNSNVSAKDKDIKIRPSSKDSPLRTQSPTFKTKENGLIKGSRSNTKQTSEKSQALSKLLNSRSRNLTNSHQVSSVNKDHSSSSAIKCQEKNSSAASKNGESDLPKVKDSSKEALPAVPVSRQGMLQGYKIPKKSRTENSEENSLDLKRGSFPQSPLPDQTDKKSSYHANAHHCWRKMEPKDGKPQPRTNINGDIRESSGRLILKLKKDTSDTKRWKTDPNNFNRNMNNWDYSSIHHQRLPPPRFPPFIPQHMPPPPRWPQGRTEFPPPVHMGYGNAPYT